MNDHQPPFEIQPDEHLEARITAYVLGEASPFEAAEIEALIKKSPELKLFANRTRTLNKLLKEAETTSNAQDTDWKLPEEKREKLETLLGPATTASAKKESRIRRASFRAAFGIAACVVVTLFTLHLFPRGHEAEAIIEIKPRGKMIDPITGATSPIPSNSFETEFVQIKSSHLLEQVVDNLDLTERWKTDKESALKKLKDSIETEKLKESNMIAIRVRQPNEQDAKEITRAVTEGYRDYRNALQEKQLTTGINELRRAVRDQQDKVAEARQTLTTIARTKNLVYYGDRSLATQNGLDEDAAAKYALSSNTELENEKTQLETQIDSLLDYDSDQLMIYSAGLDLPDNVVKNLYPRKLELKREIAGLKASGLGDDHPTIKSKNEALAGMGEQLDEAVVNLRSRLQGQLENTKERLAKAEFRKPEALERSIDLEDYDDAKQDFETELARLDQLMSKIDSAEINTSITDDTIVIHEMPSESEPAMLTYAAEKTKSAAPTSPLARALASNSASPTAIPVPDVDLAPSESTINLNDSLRTDRAEMGSIAAERTSGINIGGQVQTPGTQDFKEGLTLQEAIVRAGGATEFGSSKRVRVFRDGKTQTFDLSDDNIAQIELQPGDVVEMPQKNFFGCAPNRDETIAANQTAPSVGSRQSGDAIDAFADSSQPSFAATSETPQDSAQVGFNDIQAFDQSRPRIVPPAQPRNRSVDPFSGPSTALAAESEELSSQDEQIGGLARRENSKQASTSSKPPAPTAVPVPTAEFAVRGTDIGETQGFTGSHVDAFAESNLTAGFRSGHADTSATTEFRDSALADGSESLGLKKQKPSGSADKDWKFDQDTIISGDEESPVLEDVPAVGRLFLKEQSSDLKKETLASQDPFSTFSLNISDASFQIAQAAIAKGERPDPASIKPEQFYNAVNYGDPAPLSHEPVAAAIDQTAHPIIPGRNLVRVGIRTASTGRSAAQPLRLTLLVDQSGSMVRSDRRAAMETALAQLATLLTENDQVTVIGFSRTPRLLADSLPGDKANQLSDLINQTANEGGTNLEEAIKLASEMALRHQLAGAQNRIVLFTDGAANLGNADPERLAKNIELIRQQGLAFDIAGIGTDDVNDQLLAELARHGNGRYYLVNETTGNSLATQLAGAFRPAAENVKVQVKLNPERVGNYKLIGFEKDRLKTEDFRNDAVDAAELAADEAGVAIYQVEPLPEGSGEIGEVSVRFRDTASGEMVERSWTIPYEAATQPFDKAYPKTQLATLSLLAAQKLQGGPLADAIDFNHFAKTIAELRQTYRADPKTQQMLNLINALK